LETHKLKQKQYNTQLKVSDNAAFASLRSLAKCKLLDSDLSGYVRLRDPLGSITFFCKRCIRESSL